MTDKAWKRYERAVAQRVGGRRVPVTGLGRAEADVVSDVFHFQCKLGRRFPAYLRGWLDGITETAGRTGAVGCVIWKQPGARTDDAVVILRLKDYQEVCHAAMLAWTLTQTYSSINASSAEGCPEQAPRA